RTDGRASGRGSRRARSGGPRGAARARAGSSRPRAARASVDRLQNDRACGRLVVAELVGGTDLLAGLHRRRLVARMHFGEGLAGRDGVAAFLEAADTDGVVDGVVLGAPPRAQTKRRDAD